MFHFGIALARHMPFVIPQYVQCILHGLTGVLLCIPFIFADSKRSRFGGSTRWLPFRMEIIYIFIVATLIAKVLFKQLLTCDAV